MDLAQQEAFAGIWPLLQAGVDSRKHPMHLLTLASIGLDDTPQQRILVLRGVSAIDATLRFHSDARSPKIGQINGMAVHVLGYDPGAAVQLRIRGTAEVEQAGPAADAAWDAATHFARRCYLTDAPPGMARTEPGSGLPPDVEAQQPTNAQLQPARANFAVITVRIVQIDWLHLAQTGHRRIGFGRDEGDAWSAQWLTP